MPKIVLKSNEELNRSRKKTRLIVLLISLPFLLGILFFSYKATMLYVTANQVISLTEEQNYSEADLAAQEQFENSFVDVWVAYYNLGVTSYNTGKYYDAVSYFSNARENAPGGSELCYILNGLSKSYEKIGDQLAAEDRQEEADQYYWLAQDAISYAPAECFPPPPPSESEDQSDGNSEDQSSDGGNSENSPEQQQGEEMNETNKRIDEKLGKETEPEIPDTTEQEKRDEIQEGMDQGQVDYQEDDNAKGGPQESEVDKPW